MPFEINFKNFFQDFNPSKFVVYCCLLVFCILLALRLDGIISWSYWIVFLPIWIWKVLVLVGATVGSYVWWKHPNYRSEIDSHTQYKAMMIATAMQLLLLMFEILACTKLELNPDYLIWVLVFIPLIFMALFSIATCVWAVKHERTFEMELFCSVNILQFVFLAMRLDNIIHWSWVIVFIPLWIGMCVALIGVLYAIILAIILLKSPDIIPEQRRGNMFSAVGYTCLVVPLLIFEILLVNKEDGIQQLMYIEVVLPLLISLCTLMFMSFGAKGGNHWWFGIRKDFCSFLLGACPLLQEYGNISYKLPTQQADSTDGRPASDSTPPDPSHPTEFTTASRSSSRYHHRASAMGYRVDESPRTVVPVVCIDMPD